MKYLGEGMEDWPIITWVFLQGFVLAVTAILLLILILRGKQKSLKKLEEKFEEAIEETLQKLLAENEQKQSIETAPDSKENSTTAYLTQLNIDEALAETQNKNKELTSESEVSANFELKSFLEKQPVTQSLQLRHLFLAAEKEIFDQRSSLGSDEHFDLADLENSYKTLLEELRVVTTHQQEIATLNETIGQLNATIDESSLKMERVDGVSNAFQDIEKIWQNAHLTEGNLYQNLHQFLIDNNAPEDMLKLFNQLHHDCNNVSQIFHNSDETEFDFDLSASSTPPLAQSQSLFNLRQEQGALLDEIKNKMNNAATEENIVSFLEDKLSQLEQSYNESESCIKLLENELEDHQSRISAITDSNQHLKDKLVEANINEKDLQESIANLQEQLNNIDNTSEPAQVANTGNLLETLKIQSELLLMEKRYLDLFEKAHH